ncbi:MAG: mevalonate kinase [Bernardetiaceae bacterium]|nr:mevalonate kinase [Bernardetiaceae bacterium]
MPGCPYFNSKILLFGEYSIIQNAMGLAVPYDLFQGRLVFRPITQVSSKIIQSNREISAFASYLRNTFPHEGSALDFDFTSLDFDLSQGLFFESTIPQGFGVGSSGALTASLYYRYAKNKVRINGTAPSQEEILALKKDFALMESHFHGSSSGFDPLICYLNKPLLIRSKHAIEARDIPHFSGDKGALFLLNTGRPRRTEPLVNLFLEKCQNKDFDSLCREKLVACNDNCIQAFLENDIDALFENVSALSRFQYEHFKPMIPSLFQDLWAKGLRDEDYFLKLCGAGGGGFILGFTRNFEKVKPIFNTHQVRVVYTC